LEHGHTHSVDLEHGAMPDLTARALRRLSERIERLEKKSNITPEESSSNDEDSWFYQI
jgi:hypothetical protein